MDVWSSDNGPNDTDTYFDASSNLDASPDLEFGSNFDDAYWSHDVEQNLGMEVDIKGNEYHNTNASGNAKMHNGNSFHTTNNYYAKRIFKTSGHDPVLSMPQIDSVLPTYVWMQSKSSEEKNKLLIDAVSQGQTSRAEALINAGADVDCRVEKSAHELGRQFNVNGKLVRSVSEQNNAFGRVSCNALHMAVLNGDLHSTNMLLKYGADIFAQVDLKCLYGSCFIFAQVDLKCLYGSCFSSAPSYTVLCLALASTFYESIPSLLERGAAKEIGIVSQAIREGTPLNLLESIIAAGGSVNQSSYPCTWPLLEAVSHGGSNPEYCGSVVDLLLSRGADANAAAVHELSTESFQKTNAVGSTALMVAASKRLPPIMKALLNHGAEINKEDGQGKTVLMHLYRRCSTLEPRCQRCSQQDQLKVDEILNLLLHSGADVKYRNKHSEDIYCYATSSGCCGCRHLKRLHAAGARFNREHSPAQRSLLRRYLYRDVPYQRHQTPNRTCEVVIDILEIVGGINEMNSRGGTALMHAARNGWLDIVQTLLDHDADTEVKDEKGLTALACAARRPHVGIVKLLLKRGVSLDTESVWPKRINDNITRIRLNRRVEVPFSRQSTSSRPSPFNFSDGADRCSVTPSVWTEISSRAESVYSFCDESPEPEQSLKVETPGVFTTGTPSMGRIVEAEDEDEEMADIKEESD